MTGRMPIQTVKASEKNTGGIGFQPVRAKEKQHDRQDAYPTCQCVHGLTTNNANGTNRITVDPTFV
jgi:hypothetical protein